jgi:hypothetical protein
MVGVAAESLGEGIWAEYVGITVNLELAVIVVRQ